MTAPRKLALLALLVACGDNRIHALDDAATPDTAELCGDAIVEDGEECDDGDAVADQVCDATCHFTCGNGFVDDALGETCDTSIASGDGACPTVCDDGDACTSDVVSGSGCTATCLTGPITIAVDGDGCCPAGASANNDDDCSAMCGNGIVEAGELCDTGITVGAGACPTSCNDGMACTTDTLTGAGSCAATCTHAPVVTPSNNDGCCPAGATSQTDSDCAATCGNGVVNAGELCDIAITSGPGKCPTSCDDNMACTTNLLVSAGTCAATCAFPPITAPINGDGCCPAGANGANDNDCPATCGNGVVEGTEACDDGNTVNTDACRNNCTLNALPTAFRFTDMDLKDPHLFFGAIGCSDVTNVANNQIQNQLTQDSNNDGRYDLSPTLVFRPLTQAAGATTTVDIYVANCTTSNPSSCSPGAAMPVTVTATTQTTGTCLAPLAGTTRPYNPAVTPAIAPCFSTAPTTVTVNVAGLLLNLKDARIGATFVGAPASGLTNGLLMGFLSETDANAIQVTLPIIGTRPLSQFLPGGDPPGANNSNCSTVSDKDTHDGVAGWWFYLNFTSAAAAWTGP